MKIEVLCSINSGLHLPGDIVDMEKEEAQKLIHAGAARQAASACKFTGEREIEKIIDTDKKKPFIKKDKMKEA